MQDGTEAGAEQGQSWRFGLAKVFGQLHMRHRLAWETGLQINAAAMVQLLCDISHDRYRSVLGVRLLDHQKDLLFSEVLNLVHKHGLIERGFLQLPQSTLFQASAHQMAQAQQEVNVFVCQLELAQLRIESLGKVSIREHACGRLQCSKVLVG